jgi:hypothetical protein
MMISPGFRSLALVLALGADCGRFRGMVDWAIACGKTKIRAGITSTAARGFIFQYPFPQAIVLFNGVAANNEL